VPEYRIPIDQLRVGDRIRLDTNWMDHPFLVSRFQIKNPGQIETLRAMGLESVLCISDRVRPVPPPHPAPCPDPRTDPPPSDKPPAEPDPVWEKKKGQIERQKQRQESLQRCEKRFHRTAQDFKDLMDRFPRSPEESTRKADELISEIIEELLVEEQIVFHLMNTRAESQEVYYHSLNVAILALTLGKEGGLGKDALRRLGLGALFHDLGKNRLPKTIVLKGKHLTTPERKMFELHPEYGDQEAGRVPQFPAEARKVIRQHHEKENGKGYPRGLIGPEISPYAKIVAIANTYDNHCNAPRPEDSLSPYQGLAVMFHRQIAEFDKDLLARFVRSLGVYPPGTIVQLCNGIVGIVVATNCKSSLSPRVLIYDPAVPKEEALILDLAEDPDLTIEKSVRPEHLSPEAYAYLSPRKRVVYFIDPLPAPMTHAA